MKRTINYSALRAIKGCPSKPDGHDVVQTRTIIRKTLKELANRKGGRRGGALAHKVYLASYDTYVKGINAKEFAVEIG
jgi:hypothetical protein